MFCLSKCTNIRTRLLNPPGTKSPRCNSKSVPSVRVLFVPYKFFFIMIMDLPRDAWSEIGMYQNEIHFTSPIKPINRVRGQH